VTEPDGVPDQVKNSATAVAAAEQMAAGLVATADFMPHSLVTYAGL
jgi:hypothetical protein